MCNCNEIDIKYVVEYNKLWPTGRMSVRILLTGIIVKPGKNDNNFS